MVGRKEADVGRQRAQVGNDMVRMLSKNMPGVTVLWWVKKSNGRFTVQG
jgi:hypothetical protein